MDVKTYQIYDAQDTSLLNDFPVYSANRPIDALKKHLAKEGLQISVKVSADMDVRFGVIPCVIENGRVYQLGYKRKVWFKVVQNDSRS
jgi:hypothetical protein